VQPKRGKGGNSAGRQGRWLVIAAEVRKQGRAEIAAAAGRQRRGRPSASAARKHWRNLLSPRGLRMRIKRELESGICAASLASPTDYLLPLINFLLHLLRRVNSSTYTLRSGMHDYLSCLNSDETDGRFSLVHLALRSILEC
jgi:hypothetical protein